jgi:hypothetical protein
MEKLENAADRAREHSIATIAQPKRIGAWHPTRQVHVEDPAQRGFVRRRASLSHNIPAFPEA